ncbi:alpha/beta fold hydrolase [Streptomyces sp. M10(2022)]
MAHCCGPAVDVVALPLPGRESRRREPRVTDRAGLLADLLPTLVTAAHAGPYALYGHSLGALVAYTLTRALACAGAPAPLFLAVGACLPRTSRPPWWARRTRATSS